VEETLSMAFHLFLFATSLELQGTHWFIVDGHEEDPHSLASFLHLTHHQLRMLFKGCQLTVTIGGSESISAVKFQNFMRPLHPTIEFTTVRFEKRLHMLRVGKYKIGERKFKFSDQISQEEKGEQRLPCFCESVHHEKLKYQLF